MNRNHIFNKALNLTHQEINRKVAIHEAGHAAAIYLGNKQKKLPPIFFQIFITSVNDDFQSSRFSSKSDTKYIANIDGGRLIHTLPSSIEETTDGFSLAQKIAYQCAFEADMINILAGPLAEAKYIAQRDRELINSGLIQLNDLHYFGGTSDLEKVREYLECFIANKVLREQKITALFLAAFSFVNERSNWRAITALADYIVSEDKSVIECNEIIDVLETANNKPTV
ncbi:MAG: hypothetical protein PSV18_02400 [Methylobacter sp.]|uniref:Peptidase M41 domain-containing protein n=1 Tax=Candidatus Methylobacter titanis TaxID=3053457 RepID=A0AA43TNP7_9GAMM|nr:hypothetical protein [Candidatus Methylobacter titanis]MDI1291580.1 hypothetical protein [Candidatus Methylobacter titanis]